jgi:hypothetical protein
MRMKEGYNTMLTQRIVKQMVALAVLMGVALCSSARAQTPTPTPNGEFLCSAGPQDGQPCNGDFDCGLPGVCVIAQAVCNGGAADTMPRYCGCIAGTCSPSDSACTFPTPVSPTPGPTPGICVDGLNANECCQASDDVSSLYVANCPAGVPCTGTQKVCVAGNYKGFSCASDAQCPGSACTSTGKYCSGGDFESTACVDNADCDNVDGSPGGVCLSAGQPTPTPTSTPGSAVCTGDCDMSGDVTVNELIVMVNIALNALPLSTCPIADKDGSGDVTVNEIIIAVNNALYGCGVIPTPTPTPGLTGEFLCSAGPHDGQACNLDSNCAPGGVCVIAQAVCNGGADDTLYCGCINGTCEPSTDPFCATVGGVCAGGANATECCQVADDRVNGYVANCSGGAPCLGTQKVCAGDPTKGISCLNDAVCAPSVCTSTGMFCNGGDFDGYACVDASNCLNVDGSSVGTCDGAPAAAGSGS